MATGTVQSTSRPAPPALGESVEREKIIQRQLARASVQMRLVDLALAMAVWVIGVLLLFIAAAGVDHLVGLGTVGRFVALAMLVSGSLWYLAMHVLPPLVRTINPAYAARTIEEATPTLKNSLINFLQLRQDKRGIREIVYQAVEKQAAADIVRVPVETTIDRTRLIQAGYCLCGVMAVVAAYKILSPKDPFQTVARVLAPWATIARPSRVQIIEIQPGSAEVYHGQTAPVAATIRGVRGSDSVKLHYSTADGQTIDRPIEMKVAAGDRYECTLPAETSGHAMAGGLQQNVVYRVVAGDAESQVYRLTVVSAPTIIIDRLEYQYPAYTQKPAEVVRQQGDIKAIEGTKVLLHAVANQPIKSAWLEMDPAAKEAAAELVTLSADGDQARGGMLLQLKADRQTPWHATYQVRFHNQRAEKSQQPILHKIEVIRDLPPEVQILEPQRLRVEVPEDGELTIEVRGVDPDFSLASLRLEGAAVGKPLVRVELLSDPASQPPQATMPYSFRPREHNLKAGDELSYAAVAEDNRVGPQTGQAEPNVARTKEYKAVVTAPQKKDAASGKSPPGGNEQNPAQPTAASQPGEKQPQTNQRRSSEKPSDRPAEQPQQPMNADDRQGQQERQGQKNEQQPGQQQKPQEGQGQQKNGEGQQEKQQGQQEKQQGGQQASDGQQEKQQGGQQQGGQAGENQSGAGQQGGEQQSGQSGTQAGSGSKQPSNQSGGQPSGDANSEGGAGGQPGGERQQQPSGGDGQGKAEHDGQAIERIFKDLQQRGQQNQDGQKQDGQNPDGQNPMPGGKGDERLQPAQKNGGEKNQPTAGEQGGKPEAGGNSENQNANPLNAGKPKGGDQQRSLGKKGEASDRLPDDKQGKNPSEQPSGGNKGGASQGQSKADKGEKSPPSKGEDSDPGAGKTGDEGAGQASQDKTGSGPGTRKNADRNKEQQPDSSKAEKSEPSPASSSNRQSDSKGGESGQESGGGKQGAGQSAGQEGNDSAGSKSAADQGAGKAGETGSGETGSKAGQQKQASGKTGKSGNEKGAGSATQAGEERAGEAQGKSAGEGASAQSPKAGSKGEPKTGGTSGNNPVGGSGDGRERTPPPETASVEQAADEANLEYSRKATEMVLKHLKEEEHNPDPELLDKLGWTRDDLAEFLRRWDALQKSAAESAAGKREIDEAVKSLGLRDPANRRRAGGTTSDKQRDLRDAGNRSTAPPRYRELFDAFRKGAARSSP